MIKRVFLLVLFLIEIGHSESFGQSNPNAPMFRFKTNSDVLSEQYASNKSYLSRITALREKQAKDIACPQLVSYIPAGKSSDPITLNQSDSSSMESAHIEQKQGRRRTMSPLAMAGNPDSVVFDFLIYFRVDKSRIDTTYMNNAALLRRMSSIITEQNVTHIDSLIITAYASPEAPSDYNKRLSQRRANAVQEYFLERFPMLRPDMIRAYGRGENWVGLRQLVEQDSMVPMRDEVLRVIDSNLPEDEREIKLKSLQGGTVYRYIYRNLYPRLRLGASLNVMLAETAPEELRLLVGKPAIKYTPIRTTTLSVPRPALAILPIIKTIKKESYPFAIRTNLLYDAVGALNIGMEFPYGKKKNWSAIADVAYSFWHTPRNLYALQTLEYGVENRYWFGVSERRKERNPNWAQPLKGFYAGVYGKYWQRYDVQWIDGYQGDASWSVGLTAGYAVPIGRSLSLDFGIGAGWVAISEYRHYHRPEYDENGKYHLMWQQTGIWNGLSLTKLRLSLVWMIHTGRTKEGRDVR